MADEVKLPADAFEPLDKSKHLDSEKNFGTKPDFYAGCLASIKKRTKVPLSP